MRSSMMACAAVASAAAALAGCSADSNNQFASRDTTVEYYRVFDLKTEAAPPAVARAASEGINRNVKDAVVSTPASVDVTAMPGHFKMADPAAAAAAASAPPGAPAASADRAPTCEGASWTARAAPQVRGGDNMNMVACIFPYQGGYHLDMYAVFTKPEGGLLAWPRRLGGKILGTPEKFTENTMMDVVRAIHDNTRAQVTLVEARPTLAGTPWLDGSTVSAAGASSAPASFPAASPVASPVAAPASFPVAAPGTSPASSPGAAPAAASAPAAAAPAAPVPAAQSGAQAGAQSGESTASTGKQP